MLTPVASRAEATVIRAAVTQGATGRVVDLGILSYHGPSPLVNAVMKALCWAKITYYNRYRRRLLPGIIP